MPKQYLIKGLVLILLLLSGIWARVFYLQRNHFLEAEKYYTMARQLSEEIKGNPTVSEKEEIRLLQLWKLAIREYDTAMHFYAPLSPYIQRAAKRLWQIGEMFEEEGRLDWANIAYSSIRSSFYSARSLYTPGVDWINRCDEKIADLNTRMLIEDGSIKAEDSDVERKKHLYVLKVDRAPHPFWSILVIFSFIWWVSSIILTAYKGINSDATLRLKRIAYGVLSFTAAFILWIISLLKA